MYCATSCCMNLWTCMNSARTRCASLCTNQNPCDCGAGSFTPNLAKSTSPLALSHVSGQTKL
ncbi:hypothetical protein BJ508DRAFT_89789 [Ascobolus immersus RN42]|uniref:Uncharacterized protein n=1 Tax=Ascobolus immersus RN42 TaxID=1160509 RepID=A0A3N4HGQ2_ASCIM|nr:hypothetical protein BJ508DRAFT_89789 [Ascobolus immersus RN42]